MSPLPIPEVPNIDAMRAVLDAVEAEVGVEGCELLREMMARAWGPEDHPAGLWWRGAAAAASMLVNLDDLTDELREPAVAIACLFARSWWATIVVAQSALPDHPPEWL